MPARNTGRRSSTTRRSRSASPKRRRRNGKRRSRSGSRFSRRSPRPASSIRPRITIRTITRRTRCNTASTSPGADATRAWINSGARYGNTRLGFFSADRRILVLDVLLAGPLGVLHLPRLLVRLRRSIIRCFVDLAGIDEFLGALVVVLGGGVAAFAFDFVLAFHACLLCVNRSPRKVHARSEFAHALDI